MTVAVNAFSFSRPSYSNHYNHYYSRNYNSFQTRNSPFIALLSSSSSRVKTCMTRRYYRNQNIGEEGSSTPVPAEATTTSNKKDDKGDSDLNKNSFEIGIGGDTNGELVCEKQLDYLGAGTFGDIMSDPLDEKDINNHDDDSDNNHERSIPHANDYNKSKEEIKTGLITKVGGTLESQFGHKIHNLSPLDRIALTANGNLQRIFGSYYDAPVHVHVEKCDQAGSDGYVWDRKVSLSVFGETFCIATSHITVHSPQCAILVKSGEVGIGQLFRYLDKLPKFTINDAGRNPDGGLWRKYQLKSNELTCEIREDFSPNAWNIKPNDVN